MGLAWGVGSKKSDRERAPAALQSGGCAEISVGF